MNDIILSFKLNESAVGHLTSAVQFGFILGTLGFAIFTIADRFSPSKVFLASALLGALFNLGILWDENTFASILVLRFSTGFFLAGIYPIGMKIAADYFDKGLGKSLGFLVGALVIGTAFPHLLKEITSLFSWKYVIYITSTLAAFGGLLMALLVPNGPKRKKGSQSNLLAFFRVFKSPPFRSAALGYFGHMWELYSFWAFVPIMLETFKLSHPDAAINTPLLSFFIIGTGSVSCVIGGYVAESFGTKRTAFILLALSAACCLVSPFMFSLESEMIFILFLLFWGMVVIADSPLLSTLVAHNASAEIKGTAITIVNSIGFSITITIISILLINGIRELTDSNSIYLLLAAGPLLALFALRKKAPKIQQNHS
jgi:MFS family permease